MIETYELHTGSIVLLLVGAFALAAAFSLASHARQSFTWIIVGTLLALALDPVVRGVERRFHLGRPVALAVVLTMLVTGASLAVVLLGPSALNEARHFSRDLPNVTRRLGEVPIIGQKLQAAKVPDKVETWLSDLPKRLGNDPQPVETAIRAALGGVLGAVATVVVAISILVDGRRLLSVLRRVVPPEQRERFDRSGSLLYETVGRYFAGSLFMASLTGLMMLVAGLTLGVPLAPVAAVWATVTNLIPQIGGFLGGSVFVLLGFTKSPVTGLACLVYFLVWQQIENHVLQPTIVGQAVNLSPPVTMVAALVGASTAGVPGALVAVPLLGAAKAIWTDRRQLGDASTRRERRVGRLRRLARRVRPRRVP